MDFGKYFKELNRRNVFKVAITYGITAWLLLQIVETVVPIINAPNWVLKFVLILLIIGFPIALIFAWAFEMSPKGIIRTGSVEVKENLFNSKKKKPLTNKLLIGFLLLLVVAQFFYSNFFSNGEIDNSNIELNNSSLDKSIAVLPLINISGNNSLEYFSDGVTQEIIDELAKINTFVLTAFSSSYQYKGKKEKLRSEIAKELNVDFLIQGSAKVYKDSVYLSIELINPYNNERIWNGKYNELLDNSPKLQSAIAKQVASSLNIQLSPEEKVSLGKVNTDNGESFKLFLQAKTEIIKLTKEGFSNSARLLNKAIELDPNYSQAHTLLAWAYVFGGTQFIHSNNISTFESEKLALPHIEKAIELDKNSSDIYLVRGNYNLNNTGLLRDSKRDVEHALELNSWPRVPTNYCICTVVSLYVTLDEYENAKKYLELSKSVDPENVFIHFDEGLILMAEGHMKEAQEKFEMAVEVTNDAGIFNFFLGWSYYHDNQFEEAIRVLRRKYDIGELPLALNVAYLSNAYHKLGNKNESEKYRLELESRLASGEHHINISLAMIEAGRNHKNETLTYLEKALLDRESAVAYMTNNDPIFNSLHEDPRFIEIRKKMQYYE